MALMGLLRCTLFSVTLSHIDFDNHLCLDTPCSPVSSLMSLLSCRPMHSVSYWNICQPDPRLPRPRHLKFNIHKTQPSIFLFNVLLLLSLCHWRVLSCIQFPESESCVMLASSLCVNLKPNSVHRPFLMYLYPLHSPIMLTFRSSGYLHVLTGDLQKPCSTSP